MTHLAEEHHAKAGAAMKKGDKPTAMHHVGHMLKALRMTESGEQKAVGPSGGAEPPYIPSGVKPPVATLRMRVRKMGGR